MIVEELKQKYNLKPNSYYSDSPYTDNEFNKIRRAETDLLEKELMDKWKDRIPKGWYGFSLSPCPKIWFKVIDEFLEWVKERNPDFEIHQIKAKFASIRFYIGSVGIETEDACLKLEELLTDRYLIY